jgi:hypothetical protein
MSISHITWVLKLSPKPVLYQESTAILNVMVNNFKYKNCTEYETRTQYNDGQMKRAKLRK